MSRVRGSQRDQPENDADRAEVRRAPVWGPGSLNYSPSSDVPPPVPGRPSFAESILLHLFRRFPSKTNVFRDYSGNATFEYEDECESPFWRFFGRGRDLFEGFDVLDLGCGWGGRSVRWLEVGAESVLGVEVAQTQVSLAREFARQKRVEHRSKFLIGVGEEIPCADASVDLVVMYDVLEHVVDPERVIAECYRVLRPGGQLATVFPPYYDVFGGSHLHGYATSVPGLNLFFTTRTLRRATLRFFAEQGMDHRPYFRDIPSDKLWNMNGLTIRGFERIVARSSFDLEQFWLLAHFDQRVVDRDTPASSRWRALVRPMAHLVLDAAPRIPLLREAFCYRVCALLHKAESGTTSRNA